MKTINKKAVEYSLSKHESDGRLAQTYTQMAVNCANDFKAGVEFAQRWISVDEELPEIFMPILAKCKNKGDKVFLSEYLGYGKGSFTNTETQVTHWRQIELK